MRLYALALGILITMGYGRVAQVAIRSARLEPAAGAPRDRAASAPSQPQLVWCGGTLAPITVEVYGVAPPPVLVTGLARPEPAGPCAPRARPRDRAT